MDYILLKVMKSIDSKECELILSNLEDTQLNFFLIPEKIYKILSSNKKFLIN